MGDTSLMSTSVVKAPQGLCTELSVGEQPPDGWSRACLFQESHSWVPPLSGSHLPPKQVLEGLKSQPRVQPSGHGSSPPDIFTWPPSAWSLRLAFTRKFSSLLGFTPQLPPSPQDPSSPCSIPGSPLALLLARNAAIGSPKP